MSGDQACPKCGDPIDGPRGFVTVGNTDYVCGALHGEGAPNGSAPQAGDQDDPSQDDTPKGYPSQRTDQLRLGEDFPAPLVRREDPPTSLQAADAVHRSGGFQRRRLAASYQILREATSEEAAEHAGIPIDSARSRTRELVALDLLEDSGRTRKTTRNRDSIVWKLVER